MEKMALLIASPREHLRTWKGEGASITENPSPNLPAPGKPRWKYLLHQLRGPRTHNLLLASKVRTRTLKKYPSSETEQSSASTAPIPSQTRAERILNILNISFLCATRSSKEEATIFHLLFQRRRWRASDWDRMIIQWVVLSLAGNVSWELASTINYPSQCFLLRLFFHVLHFRH